MRTMPVLSAGAPSRIAPYLRTASHNVSFISGKPRSAPSLSSHKGRVPSSCWHWAGETKPAAGWAEVRPWETPMPGAEQESRIGDGWRSELESGARDTEVKRGQARTQVLGATVRANQTGIDEWASQRRRGNETCEAGMARSAQTLCAVSGPLPLRAGSYWS